MDSVLNVALERSVGRRSVAASLSDTLHVGFLFPGEGLTPDTLKRVACEAGLCTGHAIFSSAVVARELGHLAARAHVPTTVFSSGTAGGDGRRRYVEVFLPSAESPLIQDWITRECATHVGLTLAKPNALRAAQQAFIDEGYRIPPFMDGQPVINSDKGVSVTYFEKMCAGRNLRIELMFFVRHPSPKSPLIPDSR